MITYKLTDQQGVTHGDCQWGENVTHKAKRGKMKLCSETVIHCYDDPYLAVLMNLIHAGIKDPILWEGKGNGKSVSDGTKRGYKEYTTIKRIPLPKLTIEQRVEIAIRCVMVNSTNEEWLTWAEGWQVGRDFKKWAETTDAEFAAARAAEYATAIQNEKRVIERVFAAESAAGWAADAVSIENVGMIPIIHEVVERGK